MPDTKTTLSMLSVLIERDNVPIECEGVLIGCEDVLSCAASIGILGTNIVEAREFEVGIELSTSPRSED